MSDLEQQFGEDLLRSALKEAEREITQLRKERDEARRIAGSCLNVAWPITETRPPLPWEDKDHE